MAESPEAYQARKTAEQIDHRRDLLITALKALAYCAGIFVWGILTR